jgi:hypothetical protein
MRTPISALVLVLVSSILAACGGEGRSRGPDARVVAMHSASSYPTLQFYREARLAGALDFAAGNNFLFEVGQYDFNIDVVPPLTSGSVRLVSFSVTLEPGREYYFVISEVGGGVLQPLVVAQAPFTPTAPNAEVSVFHASFPSPTMDIYLTAPGAVLAAANPIGTASFGQHVAPSTFAPGDYQLAFTAAGNPLNVLFTSAPMTLLPGQSNFFAITDAGIDTNEVLVQRVTNLASTFLIDVNSLATQRMINGVTDTQPRDLFLDEDFSVPFLAAVPYSVPTAGAPIATGERKISVTPAGNPGVVEVDAVGTVFPASSYTAFVAGDPGTLVLTNIAENRRRIIGEAHLRYYNAAAQFSQIGIVISRPGGVPLGAFPVVLVNGGFAEEFPLLPGDYEVTVYPFLSEIPALGPLPLTVAGEGIYSMLFLNGPTAETASVVLFDDFP